MAGSCSSGFVASIGECPERRPTASRPRAVRDPAQFCQTDSPKRGGVLAPSAGFVFVEVTMRLMKRSAAAVAAAIFLVVLAGDLPLLAQRDYKGDLFWMADPAPLPGSLWAAPPLRGWSTAGDPWSAATSFPPRVWEYHVSNAPPNDLCVELPAAIDPATGPFGMQFSTYFAEWWEGTTYRSHPNKPPGYRADLFGFFDFRGRSDRPRVGAGGLPARLIGNPGACAAATLAALQGGGDAQWMPHRRDGYGNPCLSTPHLFRLRVNMELQVREIGWRRRGRPRGGDRSLSRFRSWRWNGVTGRFLAACLRGGRARRGGRRTVSSC